MLLKYNYYAQSQLNRNPKLVDKINCILDLSEAADFVVGYFF